MKLYHGTSYDNYLSMINGLNRINKNWEQSENNKLYMWDENNKYALEDAYNSAVHCAAVYNSQYDKIIVLELNLDKNELNLDNSCDDCKFYKRYCMDLNKFKIDNCIIREFKYRPKDRAKYLYNQYHNTCGVKWESIENLVVDKEKLIQQCEELYEQYKEYEFWFNEIKYKNNIL